MRTITYVEGRGVRCDDNCVGRLPMFRHLVADHCISTNKPVMSVVDGRTLCLVNQGEGNKEKDGVATEEN